MACPLGRPEGAQAPWHPDKPREGPLSIRRTRGPAAAQIFGKSPSGKGGVGGILSWDARCRASVSACLLSVAPVGVRAGWCCGNLNNWGNAGLAARNSNNGTTNSNWNGCAGSPGLYPPKRYCIGYPALMSENCIRNQRRLVPREKATADTNRKEACCENLLQTRRLQRRERGLHPARGPHGLCRQTASKAAIPPPAAGHRGHFPGRAA